MITVEELRGIRIFAPLQPDALDFLCRAVEDITLMPGEYFVHEGEARALFVVIDGTVEISKVVSGEERTIGARTPGQFFGEVPMTLSTNFPASGRAAGQARIIKLDATSYYTLAALAPSVPAKVAWLARRYLDAIQALAAEPPDVVARVIAPRADPAARAISTFLTRNQVAFDRVMTEADAGATDDPVLELRDGSRLVDPALREVARAVGLAVEPAATDYDVVILGAGPAGLTAAVNAAAEGLRTVVIERLAPGGQAGTSTRIENYTGFPFGISGDDLASRALTQATRLGAEIVVTRSATAIDPAARVVTLDGGDGVRAAALIIATGVEWRTLPVAGVERYLGNGVYYGAARSDAAIAQGQDVCIIGAGNSAGQAALFFSRHARSVTMLVRGPSLEASMSRYLIDQIGTTAGIRVETSSQVVALHGDGALEAVDVLDSASGETSRRALTVLFVMIGADAATDWLPPEIARDAHGFILTGADAAESPQWPLQRRPFALETSAPGVFAIGDVRAGSVKRVAAGVGEGGMAVAFTHQFLALER
ncbi:FAD-dependent oxidoreductase [Microterricola viridarii]|uniref:Pyridine nucleotide-disulfide oxidoreductase n=1 Tax=Microterricola viridarii TaxID=412690 RepID=A0A109QYZ2_9MICO|nr:cyclic nucleotide-binding domain-containing thioredoxin-disulfide reductase [Microterricola viridarii]AMB59775.1 pyridine nucleotide-disulfide oxidoreductase [Microterricola viridarii]